jgi:ornithine cyclodeaminase/alanine dehydrogenase-like protein (mu-crystallin family)
MEVLHDSDIARVPISRLMDAISDYVVADFEGRTTAPPRQAVDFPSGQLVFTTGGYEQLAGFRAYETFLSQNREGEDQIVAVWDMDACVLKGVCFGTRLGALRTGALGGIAVNALAPHSATTCAVIGTGLQAETQLLAILARRELREIRVYSRQQANRSRFVERLKGTSSADIRAFDNPKEAVWDAEIVVLATDSSVPVIESAWVEGAAHITTVGPKFRSAHELPLDVVSSDWLLVSDSPQQIQGQGDRHMLFEHPRWGDIMHLGEVICGRRSIGFVRSLYLSSGLAGTEVIALDAAISYRAQAS